MHPPAFGGHPSDAHLLWVDGEKRFDEDRLRAWCGRHDLTVETDQRVDHDRAEESRKQYRIVCSWSEGESESFDMGDDEWELTTQRTPETFVEIDSEGVARVAARDGERILDLQELWTDGPVLCFRAADLPGTQRLPIERLR
ncbi:hypothetical protein GJ629_06520 [Halapricum sp. CBA1109]|uniref:hypothetical protein n=1 Tax=Halapricum sp. CBA1109 TaxID=2668068 RepID=UPI0012FB3341|nr:hypothetical protein [Halapricum sp. CBA1109]MUV89590.1 hypothetical protein [Halapricum sp. CBA1109]